MTCTGNLKINGIIRNGINENYTSSNDSRRIIIVNSIPYNAVNCISYNAVNCISYNAVNFVFV